MMYFDHTRGLRCLGLALSFAAISVPAALAQYEKGEDVRTRRGVELRFQETPHRTAPAGEILRVVACNPERGLVYVAEHDPERGLIALNLPHTTVEPTEVTLKRRLDDILSGASKAEFAEALARARALGIIDPLAPLSGRLVVALTGAEKATRDWAASHQNLQMARAEATRTDRNARVVERPNALDAGPYNQRRSPRRIRSYWNGYQYVYVYGYDYRPEPTPQPAKDPPRKGEADEMRRRSEAVLQEAEKALTAAENDLRQASDLVTKIIEEYHLDIAGRRSELSGS